MKSEKADEVAESLKARSRKNRKLRLGTLYDKNGIVLFPSPDREVSKHLPDLRVANGVWALKVLFGMSIVRGESERRKRGSEEHFPAALRVVSEASHLNRTNAHKGLQELLEKGIVERVGTTAKGEDHAAPRTAIYRFAGGDYPFFPVPYEHLRDTEFLAHARLRNLLRSLPWPSS